MALPLQKIPEKLSSLQQDKVKAIFVMALPAITENALQMMIGMVDIYYVSRLSTEAVAAVGATNLISSIYLSFFIALGIGTTAIVSRYSGSQKNFKAAEAIKQAIIIALAIGIATGFIALLFAREILSILGLEPAVASQALPYFLIVAVPAVFFSLNLTLSSAIRGTGDTVTPMKTAFIANVINAVLGYLLIFGFPGFAGWGLTGAALATTTSRLLSSALLFVKLLDHNSFKKVVLEKWKINRNIAGSMITISFPAAAEKLLMRFGQLLYGAMIIRIGTEAYAAHNIAGTIESISYLPGLGFGVAAAVMVGQSLGSARLKEARTYGFLSFTMATGLMVFLGFTFYFFAPQLAAFFSDDPEVKMMVTEVLRIIALFQPFLAMTLVITSALQGAGDTKYPLAATLIGIWGIRVLGVYYLGLVLDMGLAGVWYAYVLDITVRGILLLIRFWQGKWQRIRIE